ncbi:hypothetical protein J2S74_002680 [Evansella vedderi]|uniref:Nucleotidyltransferase n=1 Tax=Evansella vedderi TaxID=38282 RepID=A0ABT9ZVP1_9BACI|nr:nucleotidyltransferase domain-containing protein [Evansella vedderi]MDQ0255298.1 hypothetical protein [Evansella vedderi]
MNYTNRLQPYEAANHFIYKYYPNCDGALLAGSVIRGEATKTSDLDIIIFDRKLRSSYRESLLFMGWPIEVFANNLTSYKQFFKSDYEQAMPTHQMMVVEGRIIVDRGVIASIKQEARQMLEMGPLPWSKEIIDTKRYFITDVLDDFIGATDRAEEIFIANTLAEWIHEFVLRTNYQWVGESKWIVRSLKRYDPQFTEEFVSAFDDFYRNGKKQKVIDLTDKVLSPYGGRLFHGFSVGK